MSVEVLKQIWPEWELEEKILGRGSYGVVYKAVRRDYNVESYAAIKEISIPSDPSELDSLRSEGLDMNAARTYLEGIVQDFVNEIRLMESLKGIQNIVSVEDYKVVEKTRETGWDIYIRMELLTPFQTYLCDKKMSEEEIIRLGCDICSALEICARRNIIHRDIKPENIFINDFGHFKLGDFGIARKMENMTGGLSQKGTFHYMAPEVINGSKYDARVDIYSLGLVLYRLCNGNRLPFLDTEKQLLSPNERRNANERRMRGEALPAPCEASPALADLILRACAFDPGQRFGSAAEMRRALEAAADGTYRKMAGTPEKTTAVCSSLEHMDHRNHEDQMEYADHVDHTISVRKAPDTAGRETASPVSTFGSVPKKKGRLRGVLAAFLAGAGVFVLSQLVGDDVKHVSEKLQDIKVGETVSLGTYEQDNDTSNGKEEIEWLVLEVQDGKALLISKYGLDSKSYHTEEEDVTWETCSLRQWLNHEFMDAAFSDEEKTMIPTVTVSADRNPEYDTDPGNATQDQVFLLSIPEVNRYFSIETDRQCTPTDYTAARGVAVSTYHESCWWWLRSPGDGQFRAANVSGDGGFFVYGCIVGNDRSAVRPALWIDLTP